MQEKHQYLLRIAFLGFRYSGWQHQPGTRTVEGMLRKTLHHVLPGRQVRFLGAGRTDARVSAADFAIQMLLTGEALPSESAFLEATDRNLPPDIRLSSIEKVPAGFNAIRDCRLKTYRYYFTWGPKPHPYCAPLLGYFPGELNLDLMQRAARQFEGEHDFRALLASPTARTRTRRLVACCRLRRNEELTASFFPPLTRVLEVAGQGFGRYQVRRMMAALVALGRGTLDLSALSHSLEHGSPLPLPEIAPASGLHLMEVQFDAET